ncbi:CHAD domain-containing protein [Planktothrix sp. FACHB-1355]|uniref:CHAD domain-containing protein n=1 Tax=Aerosakkonema funiforme FACHB-1375 TaxID=2949571 RepID=A0A926VG90_9CYAN|nr:MULTISPECIES: CHAD domain-containing protein [Oscillatoriales]MBD2183355.1 CHAD domain-containing protein [Aerosakkonema funiforme FACHB-1375]MBD3560198.1 CHAD domain-containing protein [Planktothrix sp. FACHB-1355]
MTVDTPTKAKTLGDWAYLAVEKHFHKTLKHEADILKDKDPEALHQMRVGMRRLRTAVTGFAPALNLPKEAQEKIIGKIARTLGVLRDLDVLQESLQTHYRPELPKSEQKVVDTALDYLAQQRQQAFKDVKSTLEKSRYLNMKRAFLDWLEQPTYRDMANLPILEVLPDLLLPQISELLLHPGWLVGTKAEKAEIHLLKDMSHKAVEQELAVHGEVLHSLRKQTKRVRYQMELFTNFYGATYQAYLEDMKTIQSILGEIQDSVVLAEFLAEALGSKTDNLPRTLSEKLAESRYKAWQQWQPLQQRYLHIQIRQSFRSELLRPKGVFGDGQVDGNLESTNGTVKRKK